MDEKVGVVHLLGFIYRPSKRLLGLLGLLGLLWRGAPEGVCARRSFQLSKLIQRGEVPFFVNLGGF